MTEQKSNKPFPDFHEQGITPIQRTGRLTRAAEHPDKHLHVEKFARVLSEPFSGLHDTAANALLAIHAEKRNATALAAVVEAYQRQLREYRLNRNIPLGNFLRRLEDKLRRCGQKVELVETLKPAPRDLIGEIKVGLVREIKRTPGENAIRERVRELFRMRWSENDLSGETLGHLVERHTDETHRLAFLELAIVRNFKDKSIGKNNRGQIYAHVRVSETVQKMLNATGFKITSIKSLNDGRVEFTTEPTETLRRIINRYTVAGE